VSRVDLGNNNDKHDSFNKNNNGEDDITIARRVSYGVMIDMISVTRVLDIWMGGSKFGCSENQQDDNLDEKVLRSVVSDNGDDRNSQDEVNKIVGTDIRLVALGG